MSNLVSREMFGRLDDGTLIDRYRMGTATLSLGIITYGGRIVTLETPDRDGLWQDIVLGYDSLAGYATDPCYFGAIIGRYANRIARAQFSLDGETNRLSANNGAHSLHGGRRGFDTKTWTAETHGNGLTLRYRSESGEEGYPGSVDVTVSYSVIDDYLRIDYLATSDRDTVINLTNHGYFNLSGRHDEPVLDHEVCLHANQFTPVTAQLIPTGEIRDVANSPFDFRAATRIGAHIDEADEQLEHGRGYDHNFVLTADTKLGDGTLRDVDTMLRHAAEVYESTSGRRLDVLTTQPGLHFYTGNQLDGTREGKRGQALGKRCGFCLETQHFPDSPHQPLFPSTRLTPNRPFRSTTIYRFTTCANR